MFELPDVNRRVKNPHIKKKAFNELVDRVEALEKEIKKLKAKQGKSNKGGKKNAETK